MLPASLTGDAPASPWHFWSRYVYCAKPDRYSLDIGKAWRLACCVPLSRRQPADHLHDPCMRIPDPLGQRFHRLQRPFRRAIQFWPADSLRSRRLVAVRDASGQIPLAQRLVGAASNHRGAACCCRMASQAGAGCGFTFFSRSCRSAWARHMKAWNFRGDTWVNWNRTFSPPSTM